MAMTTQQIAAAQYQLEQNKDQYTPEQYAAAYAALDVQLNHEDDEDDDSDPCDRCHSESCYDCPHAPQDDQDGENNEDDQDDEVHGQCEDYPCCGHEAGCCPSRSRKTGKQTNMVCTCGARLPLHSRFSICDSCLNSGDDEDGRGDDHECDY